MAVMAAALTGLLIAVAGVLLAVFTRNKEWRGSPLGYLVGTTALVALFALLALGALDSLLSRMHVLGIADRGIEDITGFGLGTSPDLVAETILRWAEWYRQAKSAYVAQPSVVLRDYLIIDSILLVPAYVTLLAMVRWRGRWVDPKRPSKELWPDFGAVARRLILPIAIAIADLTENVITEFAIRSPLRTLESRASVGEDVAIADITLSDSWLVALRYVTALKWVLLTVMIIYTIPSLVNVWVSDPARQDRIVIRNALFKMRALIGTVVIFGVIVVMRLQIPDVIRRWSPAQGLLAALAVTVFGVVCWIWSRRTLVAKRGVKWRPTRYALLGIGGALGIIFVISRMRGSGPVGLAIPAAALLLVAWLDWLGPSEPETLDRFVDEEPADQPKATQPPIGHTALPRLLAIAPGLLLGVAALRALLPETVFNHPNDALLTIWIVILTIAVPIAGAMVMFFILGTSQIDRLSDIGSSSSIALRIIGLAVGIYFYSRVVMAVWSFSQGVGALVIVASFMTIVAVGIGALSVWVETVPPPAGLGALGFQRTPVFAFFLVWVLLVGLVERQDYHDVRIDLAASASLAPTTVDEAFGLWEMRNSEVEPSRFGRRPIPMLFVAANGGGIKAATWAAFALDCVLRGGDGVDRQETRDLCEAITPEGANRTGNVFAMSGVSGGSTGLAEFVVHEIETQGEPDSGWIRRALGDDFVSPSVAWQLFVEVPRTFLQFTPGMDRAEVMERSWERGWFERSLGERAAAAAWGSDDEISSPLQRGLFSSWEEFGTQIPLLLLNSATVEDGCRVIVSPLSTDGTGSDEGPSSEGGRNCTGIGRLDGPLPQDQLFPASRDIRHFVCGSDLRMSTAAMASARFPWVSPSGRLPFCGGDSGSVHVIDGGYLDNSGGETIAELWDAVRERIAERNAASSSSCVVPYLILIDSGYGPTPESKQDDVPELLVPLKGFFAAGSSRTIEGRNEAALKFRQQLIGVATGDRLATLYLRTQPSGEAPLGWTLDDTTIDALEAQLASNSEALAEIADWFTETDACAA